ncbi:hypothetical protein TWF281_004437 [Arthrobotrys megalospora]
MNAEQETTASTGSGALSGPSGDDKMEQLDSQSQQVPGTQMDRGNSSDADQRQENQFIHGRATALQHISPPGSSVTDHSLRLSPFEIFWKRPYDMFYEELVQPESPSSPFLLNNKNVEFLSKAMATLPTDPMAYSDPPRQMRLPFPHIGRIWPARFDVVDGYFDYMGRTGSQHLASAVNELINKRRPLKYYFNGTAGWGKSHLLAALACYLGAKGERVIYIPDCGQLLESHPLNYLKGCVLSAYTRDEDKIRTILEAKSFGELGDFLQSESVLGVMFVFIVDRINALDRAPGSGANISNERKDIFQRLLYDISGDEIMVIGSSANLEMVAWWNHNEESGRLPRLLSHNSTMTPETEVNDRRKEIEYLTGCNFLLLGTILQAKMNEVNMETPVTWPQFKASLVGSEAFDWVKNQITEFHYEVARSPRSNAAMNMYRSILNGCITNSRVPPCTSDLVDWRFLDITRGSKGTCSSGFARSLLIRLVHEMEWGD